MSRIEGKFEALRKAKRKALIPFITAGDPTPGITVQLMRTLVDAGADLIELGVPFSDPMADGPVIQRASERALEHDVGLHHVLDMVREFREQDDETPVVLMGYLNPIEVMGYQAFAEAAADAGVDGALTVDMPPEESHDLIAALQANALDPIYLLAPTSTAARIQRITAVASGFVYYVALKGVTGAANLDVEAVTKKLTEIRTMTDLPLGVGFGIKDAATAAQVAKIADAAVVGSALVARVEANADMPDRISAEIHDLVGSMRSAMDTVQARGT